MPNANPSTLKISQMKGILHVVLETPKSKSISILSQAFETNSSLNHSFFLVPAETKQMLPDSTVWELANNSFEMNPPHTEREEEWFLFLSNQINLPEQIEAILSMLAGNALLHVGRFVSFVNAEYLREEKIVKPWMDAIAHFSDAICFTNRTNGNGFLISEYVERYKSLRYPLETYILSSKKPAPLSQILSPTARRISHVFDPVDLLDPEDSPDSDFYLTRKASGERARIIPLPFSNG